MNRIGIFITLSLALFYSGSGVAQTSVAGQVQTTAYENGLRSFLKNAQSADARTTDADFIVALVNSETITYQEVKARWERLQSLAPGGRIPAQERAEALYRLMDDLVTERLQDQAGKLAGVSVEPAAVDNAITSIAKQNDLTLAQLRERLSRDGLGYDEFKARIAAQLLSQRVRERFTDTRPYIANQIIDAEIALMQTGVVPPILQINLAHLLFSVPENGSNEQEKEVLAFAQNVVQRAISGVEFAQLAEMAENRASKADAKGMGLKEQDRYPTLFVEAIANIPVGAVTAPIKSGAGYHVLKVLEKKESPVVLVSVTETRARHILLPTNNASDVERATVQLAALRDEITSGKKRFAEAAKAVSQDGSAQAGGDLGWTSPGLFVPEFEKPMMQLPIGQVSLPVVSRFGVHLIEVVERREARVPRSVLRERVLGHLRETKAQESYKAWNQELRDRAYIEWREAPRL
jgi:peptidyl-prolyl cis-trans isomerase SurA